jgi:chemotaxis protein MotB
VLNFFRENKVDNQEEKTNFWISYADIMAALLLMFILLLSVIMLDARSAEQSAVEAEIKATAEKNRTEELEQDLKKQKIAIARQEEKIKKQKNEIEAKTQEIDKLLGVREEIIIALQQKFADTDLSLEIDSQTGAIRLPGGVFFDTDSTEITDEGIKFLESFIPQYVGILLGPDFKEYVAQIIIEGHTDDVGSYMYNLELSQNRAFEVVTQIYDESFTNFEYKNRLRDYLTANGRSYSQPIKNKNGEINRERSRRVEFKFRLKDTEMINDIKNTLGE